MIEKDIAKKQVLRLGQMVRFPKDNPVALGELVLAVQAAESEETAKSAITAYLDTATCETPCPMPAEIRGWIYERQGVIETESKKRTAGCRECAGTGWKHVTRGMYSGVEACRCRRGESAA